jgi:hypothetical protein
VRRNGSTHTRCTFVGYARFTCLVLPHSIAFGIDHQYVVEITNKSSAHNAEVFLLRLVMRAHDSGVVWPLAAVGRQRRSRMSHMSHTHTPRCRDGQGGRYSMAPDGDEAQAQLRKRARRVRGEQRTINQLQSISCSRSRSRQYQFLYTTN